MVEMIYPFSLTMLLQYLEVQQARATHYTSIDESVLEVGVALEQLVPQKRRVLKVCV